MNSIRTIQVVGWYLGSKMAQNLYVHFLDTYQHGANKGQMQPVNKR